MAVVTGGASGIGAATVQRLVQEGARVVIADVQEGPGQALATRLGPAATFLRTDVTKEAEVAAAVDAGAAITGRLDVVVNNAGILGAVEPIDALDMAEYDYTMAVNLRGVVMGVKHAARVMKRQEQGAIVCTGSTSAVMAGLAPHAYTTAKSGLHGLVRSAAYELRGYGVRVNAVAPDTVATPLVAHGFATFPGMPDGFGVAEAAELVAARSLVKGQVLTPEVVAAAIAFLASDDARYLTGQSLVVDGGKTTSLFTLGLDDHFFTQRMPILREAGIRILPP